MGFFDSYRKSFEDNYEKERKRFNELEYRKNQKRDLEEKERGKKEELEALDNMSLFQELKSNSISLEKKELIEKNLSSRGYCKDSNGNWDILEK